MRINNNKIIYKNINPLKNNKDNINSTNKKKSFKRFFGKNSLGRITIRRRHNGHKKLYREIDFKRDLYNIPGIVGVQLYDPLRTSYITDINYYNIFKRYILLPQNLKTGNIIKYSNNLMENSIGNTTSIKNINDTVFFHNIQIKKDKKAQYIRSGGGYSKLLKTIEKDYYISLSKYYNYIINEDNKVTIGKLSVNALKVRKLKKAGDNYHKGKRPHVRGVAMNPVDHPHGGGEGKTSGGGPSVSPTGILTKGYPTVIKKSNKTVTTEIKKIKYKPNPDRKKRKIERLKRKGKK